MGLYVVKVNNNCFFDFITNWFLKFCNSGLSVNFTAF